MPGLYKKFSTNANVKPKIGSKTRDWFFSRRSIFRTAGTLEKTRISAAFLCSFVAYLSLKSTNRNWKITEVPAWYHVEKTAGVWYNIQKDIAFEESITPIRFRTTVLSDIYADSKDVKLAQAAAGHTTAAMTLERYIKRRDHVVKTASVIDRVYSSNPQKSSDIISQWCSENCTA